MLAIKDRERGFSGGDMWAQSHRVNFRHVTVFLFCAIAHGADWPNIGR